MSEPFIAEIRMVGFNFPPKGWATCNGQLLAISQNTALFSILGTTYGGNGQTTFALPDLRGRVALHMGQGPGLSPYDEGQIGGEESHTLLTSELPLHNHGGAPVANSAVGTSATIAGNVPATPGGVNARFAKMYSTAAANATNNTALAAVGSGLPHNNLMPYLAINYIVALQGVFPPRN